MAGFIYLNAVEGGREESEKLGEKREGRVEKKNAGRATKAFKTTCEKSAVL